MKRFAGIYFILVSLISASHAETPAHCGDKEVKLFTCRTTAKERITVCMRPNYTFSITRDRPGSQEARYLELRAEYADPSVYAKGSESIVSFKSPTGEMTLFIKKDAYAVWPTHVEAKGFDVTHSMCVPKTDVSPIIPLDGKSGFSAVSIDTLGAEHFVSPMQMPPDWPSDMISN